LDERDWETKITVLSGDIDHNDHTDTNGVVIDPDSIVGNNSYHVVRAESIDSTAILDGFVFTAGKANGSSDPDFFGGGMYNYHSNPTLNNCILWGNSASYGIPEIYNVNSTPIISYSDIQGCGGSENWDPSFGVDSGYNIDADPLFVDMGNGDLHLQSGSPAIDAGNNDALPPDDTTDLDGNPRIVDGDLDGDTIVDMGAYEYQPPTFVHENGPISITSQFISFQIYPNPSHLSTTIRFNLPAKSRVELKIYDVPGREVSTLINQELNAGIHQIEFDGSNLPSGVYFYRLVAGSLSETKKVVLRK